MTKNDFNLNLTKIIYKNKHPHSTIGLTKTSASGRGGTPRGFIEFLYKHPILSSVIGVGGLLVYLKDLLAPYLLLGSISAMSEPLGYIYGSTSPVPSYGSKPPFIDREQKMSDLRQLAVAYAGAIANNLGYLKELRERKRRETKSTEDKSENISEFINRA
ncbi:MAG: hypothetical protein QXH92_04295 [Candidatus Aenigmatarchaeota archaeon]